MANQVYKCKVCGGDLAWDPAIQKLKCRFCDEEYDLSAYSVIENTEIDKDSDGVIQESELEEKDKGKLAEELGYTEATDDSYNDVKDLRVYKCQNCGAEIVTDKATVATHCVYCNNPVVLTEQLVEDFQPEYLIPFRIERSKITEMYINYIKKPFTPDSFLSESHISLIKGVYVPFWLYDLELTGMMKAECDNITHSSDSNYNYSHHHIYDVNRVGKLDFKSIPVDASLKIPDDAMDSIEPFNMKDLVKFDTTYLAGYLAERFTVSEEDSFDRAKSRSLNTMIDVLRKTIKGYSSVSIKSKSANALKKDSKYVMLPVYILFTNYEGEEYIFAVNGQTGKIRGNVPVDKSKLLKYFISRFLVSGSLGVLFFSFILPIFL